jgi:hypothetical protein
VTDLERKATEEVLGAKSRVEDRVGQRDRVVAVVVGAVVGDAVRPLVEVPRVERLDVSAQRERLLIRSA